MIKRKRFSLKLDYLLMVPYPNLHKNLKAQKNSHLYALTA